jgi:hypothetical protein
MKKGKQAEGIYKLFSGIFLLSMLLYCTACHCLESVFDVDQIPQTARQHQIQLKDPTTLSVQSINQQDLHLHQIGDPIYPGMSGEFYDLAVERGAQSVIIPQYSTYFMVWLPPEWGDLPEKRLLFLYHGHDGTAAPRLNYLFENATKYQFGMVSVQWGWRPEKEPAYRYLDETENGMRVAYDIVRLALDYIGEHHGVDRNLSAWNGFSRSSGHSIVYAYLDMHSGEPVFQLYMGIAGGFNIRTPFVDGLVNGDYGQQPIEGMRSYLWCGTEDTATGERVIEGIPDSVCERQALSQEIITQRGGEALLFTRTPQAGHMTWNSNPELQVEAIELWYQLTTD